MIKMKYLWFLISFFFVNIMANDLSDYKECVWNITDFIRQAYEKRNVTVGGISRANGLEHIIEIMVDDVNSIYKDFRKINCLIAVPERPNMIFKVPGPYYSNILKKAKHFHDVMLKQMSSKLGIKLYEVRYQIWGTLKTLGDDRRDYVIPALNNIITRILGEPVQNDVAFTLRLCRFMGLYLSTHLPNAYIKKIQIEPIFGTCILRDINKTNRRYGKIGDVWSELSLEDVNVPVQSIEQQLRLGFPQVKHSSVESVNSLEKLNDYYALTATKPWPWHRL
ncbi:uncharacterized protein LOC126839992 [Adelges cooleyi]|uniref:uncharacterized protein LOC126839992 n=1 Tax=Adelges cooleyi TaxID=133065 RepID=UPI00217F36AF|nr:uncharacterized protein LOC126839992 [Adelges cooleyi]